MSLTSISTSLHHLSIFCRLWPLISRHPIFPLSFLWLSFTEHLQQARFHASHRDYRAKWPLPKDPYPKTDKELDLHKGPREVFWQGLFKDAWWTLWVGKLYFRGIWPRELPASLRLIVLLDAPGFASTVIIQPSIEVFSAGFSSGRKKSRQVLGFFNSSP